jgi:hypothetical protein
LNSSPNRSHFDILRRNCADFVKDIINIYQPKSLHRSYVADLGISTPMQMGKRLVKFSVTHPELRLSRFIIPQVPGNIARSDRVHRVVGSILRTKKYIIPIGVASPIAAGCLAVAYVGSGGGRFNPGQDAMIFTPGAAPESPLTSEERRAYRKVLKNLVARTDLEKSAGEQNESGDQVQSKAEYRLDQNGRPLLELNIMPRKVIVGASETNVLTANYPSKFIQALYTARLQSELGKRSARKVSDRQVARDLQMLQRAIELDYSVEASFASRPSH